MVIRPGAALFIASRVKTGRAISHKPQYGTGNLARGSRRMAGFITPISRTKLGGGRGGISQRIALERPPERLI